MSAAASSLSTVAATPTVQHLKITAMVASESALTPTMKQSCVVDADLYTPKRVNADHPAPAILTTNGFGGSKADQAALGMAYASKGYVVLSYSGLGFGSTATTSGSGSQCKITLDDREHDGAAASQPIDFLAGKTTAKDDKNQSVTVNYVTKDKVDHNGMSRTDDPRVGMVGGMLLWMSSESNGCCAAWRVVRSTVPMAAQVMWCWRARRTAEVSCSVAVLSCS